MDLAVQNQKLKEEIKSLEARKTQLARSISELKKLKVEREKLLTEIADLEKRETDLTNELI